MLYSNCRTKDAHCSAIVKKNKKQTQLQNQVTHFKMLSEYKFEVDTSNLLLAENIADFHCIVICQLHVFHLNISCASKLRFKGNISIPLLDCLHIRPSAKVNAKHIGDLYV